MNGHLLIRLIQILYFFIIFITTLVFFYGILLMLFFVWQWILFNIIRTAWAQILFLNIHFSLSNNLSLLWFLSLSKILFYIIIGYLILIEIIVITWCQFTYIKVAWLDYCLLFNNIFLFVLLWQYFGTWILLLGFTVWKKLRKLMVW